ncbi:MAG: GNAT family N-acetyltransferase [Acidimicrobiia bacterium]
MEQARPATAADVPRLTELARELRDELATYRGGGLWRTRDVEGEPLDAKLEALLDRRDAAVIVGTIDDVPVGYGVVVIEPLRDGSCIGVISELFVEPDARSVGVGEAIASAIVDDCRVAGCTGVDVVALPGHRATKNFFEEQGFTARAITMHHQIGEATDEESDAPDDVVAEADGGAG